MKNIVIGLILVLVVVVGGYYLFFNKSSDVTASPTPLVTDIIVDTSTPEPTVSPSTTPTSSTSATPKASPASTVTVDIKNFAFSPATRTIKAGTKVTWTNSDSVSHTVTSDSGNLLNSPTLAPGQSFSFTFNSVGTTNYHCTAHPSMKGSIVVTK